MPERDARESEARHGAVGGRERRRPSLGLVLSALVPALAVGGLLALTLAPSVPARDSAAAERRIRHALDSSPSLRPTEGVVASSGEQSALAGEPRPSSGPRPGAPTSLAIPSAHVRARIEAVKATRTGLTIPPPGRTGWYSDGPRPGEPGRALLVGHVDTRRGPAVFAGLRSLDRDDRVTVTDESGRRHRFRVVAVEQVAKSRFPRHDVYGTTVRRALVLVTCGGDFAPGPGYRDNVIVYARAA